VTVSTLSSTNGEFAFTEGVPQFDGLVTGTRNNLSVVSRESNAENVLVMSAEDSGGFSRVDLPQSESSVPRSRQSKLGVRRNHNVLDKVGVSSKGSLGNTIVGWVISGQLPDENGFISRGREDSVAIFSGGGN